jgi:hypothetical protein
VKPLHTLFYRFFTSVCSLFRFIQQRFFVLFLLIRLLLLLLLLLLAVVRPSNYRSDLPIHHCSILIFLRIKRTLIALILFYISQTVAWFVKVSLNTHNGHLYDQQSRLVVQAVITSTSLTPSCERNS